MSMLTHLLGRKPGRVSRFHTLQGDLATPREGVSAVPSILRRARLIPGRQGPWMASSAVVAIQGELRPSDVVLELGGGESTRWLLDRSGRVITLESDAKWASSISAAVAGKGEHRLVTGSVADLLVGVLQEERPTFAIVDHLVAEPELSRPDAAELCFATASVRVVVVDDSDRYWADDWSVDGFERRDCRGFRPYPFELTQTSLFVRRQQH